FPALWRHGRRRAGGARARALRRRGAGPANRRDRGSGARPAGGGRARMAQAARRRAASGAGTIGPSTSRWAMNSGLGFVSPKGATSRFDQALKTMNALLRPYGVMLPFEPCMVLQSNTTTDPAFGAGAAMP